ncbi:pinin SDK memA domain [Cordyceps militaris]|uniref:Pinin SDK memA domain n=1 Tax=Cordyceps militaris TaxID=73501 RepID=A0A2H4SLD0_CORMI|nr:pinin SDK memA domain [Cordyceps militaris]
MASPEAMAAVQVQTKAEDTMEITDSRRDAPPLKRKASPEPQHGDEIPKRTRHDSDEDDRDRSRRRSRSPERDRTSQRSRSPLDRAKQRSRSPQDRTSQRSRSPPDRARQRSRSPDRRRIPEAPAIERRAPTQEDKKRGKRLFGGLLSTLNQGPSNLQQKRRQEIEKRQQERLQKQDSEDGQRRAERLSQLRAVRIREQIVFDEEVMRNRHKKKLALARYLQTKAEPHIYYLPWRCTDEELDLIDEQRSKARDDVQREESEFEKRRTWHVERHGTAARARPPSLPREQTRSPPPLPDTAPAASPMVVEEGDARDVEEDRRPEGHDDAGDIVEHDGQDMVIY